MTSLQCQIKADYFEKRRQQKIKQIKKFIKENSPVKQRKRQQFLQLALPNEQRALRYSHQRHQSARAGARCQSAKPLYLTGIMSETYDSPHAHPLDISEIGKRNRERLENFIKSKQNNLSKLQIMKQSKLESKQKLKKQKEEQKVEDTEVKEYVLENKHQKYEKVIKKRDYLDESRFKEGKEREKQLLQRLDESGFKREQYYSDIQSTKRRPQSAYKFSQKTDFQQSVRDLQSRRQSSEVSIEEQISNFQQRMEQAEVNRRSKLNHARLKSAKLNQHARAKNLFWLKKEQENEYNRMLSLLTKQQRKELKEKEKNEDKKDDDAVREYHDGQKQFEKKQRRDLLQRDQMDRKREMIRKIEERTKQAEENKQAALAYVQQKREINNLKKEEQEKNLVRTKRVQSAYKRMLVDKIVGDTEKAEEIKEMRRKMINENRREAEIFKAEHGFA